MKKELSPKDWSYCYLATITVQFLKIIATIDQCYAHQSSERRKNNKICWFLLCIWISVCAGAFADAMKRDVISLDQVWEKKGVYLSETNSYCIAHSWRYMGFLLQDYPKLSDECIDVMRKMFPVVMDAAEKSTGNSANPKILSMYPFVMIALAETPTMRHLAEISKRKYALNGVWSFGVEKFDFEKPNRENGRSSRVFHGFASALMKSDDNVYDPIAPFANDRNITLVASKYRQCYVLKNGCERESVWLLEDPEHGILYGFEYETDGVWLECKRCVSGANLRVIELQPGSSVEIQLRESPPKGSWRLLVRVYGGTLGVYPRMNPMNIKSKPVRCCVDGPL